MEATTTSSRATKQHRELAGRVVLLHFKCHAELPLGSFLRVTGSTLWAPGTAASDPSDAAPAVGRTEQSAFPVIDEDLHGPADMASLYASSVEMVTTPDEYPIWRTRKPVTVVIHNTKRTTQHHYFRYLVVSPGGSGTLQFADSSPDEEVSHIIVSTSNEMTGSTPVMMWEDPFGTLKDKNHGAELSAVSLASSVTTGQVTKADYRNLPYRTLDIDVKTGRPVFDDTDELVRLDHWCMADDDSFRPYRIREAVSD